MTTVPSHQQSEEVIQEALQMFDLPGTDTSVTAYRIHQLTTVTTGINPMEFVMPAMDEFVGLSRSYSRRQIRLKKSDNRNLANGQSLYPTINLAHTLIKQLTIHMNWTLVSP